MLSEIQVKELPPQLIFSWRGKVRVSEIPARMGEAYGRIYPYLMGQHVEIAGPPLAIYHEMPHDDEPMEMEVGVPVPREVAPLESLATHELEGGAAVTAIYQGTYEQIGSAYDELTGWVQGHDYEVSGPPREAYLNGPDDVKDPSEYLTEVIFPVRKKVA